MTPTLSETDKTSSAAFTTEGNEEITTYVDSLGTSKSIVKTSVTTSPYLEEITPSSALETTTPLLDEITFSSPSEATTTLRLGENTSSSASETTTTHLDEITSSSPSEITSTAATETTTPRLDRDSLTSSLVSGKGTYQEVHVG